MHGDLRGLVRRSHLCYRLGQGLPERVAYRDARLDRSALPQEALQGESRRTCSFGSALRILFPDREKYLMTHIDEDDVIRSVAEALQYISYYYPPDFVKGVVLAYLAGASTCC
jgi:hypothetical protein